MPNPHPDGSTAGSEPPALACLTVADLPELEDRAGIVRLTRFFEGYLHFGSFEACAAEAKARRRETLVDLMNELFFSIRASRHRGDDDFVATYAELRPLLVAQLSKRGSD